MRSGIGDLGILHSIAGVGAWVSITTRPLRANAYSMASPWEAKLLYPKSPESIEVVGLTRMSFTQNSFLATLESPL